jgi:hypothetical protein
MEYWGEDRLFRLFLKYEINEKSSLDFVKKFVSDRGISDKKTIRAFDLKLHWLGEEKCERKQKFHEIMQKNIDFFILSEEVLPFEALKKIRDCAAKHPGENCTPRLMDLKHQVKIKQTYYLTPAGIIKAYEMFPADMKTPEISVQFQKMVFYSAVMSDTDCGQNPIGNV